MSVAFVGKIEKKLRYKCKLFQ